MVIKQLMHLLNEKASIAVRKMPIQRYSGQIVACDASMAIYQFIAATLYSNNTGLSQLTDSEGHLTAHLVGLLNRTLLFLENHIKPVWVFDGKPPTLKQGELKRRKKVILQKCILIGNRDHKKMQSQKNVASYNILPPTT